MAESYRHRTRQAAANVPSCLRHNLRNESHMLPPQQRHATRQTAFTGDSPCFLTLHEASYWTVSEILTLSRRIGDQLCP